MSRGLLKELLEAVNSANSDDNIRVVILSSSGKLFCAGADLKDSSMSDKGSEQHLMEDHFPILSAIKNSTKPYIAQVQGGAAGCWNFLCNDVRHGCYV